MALPSEIRDEYDLRGFPVSASGRSQYPLCLYPNRSMAGGGRRSFFPWLNVRRWAFQDLPGQHSEGRAIQAQADESLLRPDR